MGDGRGVAGGFDPEFEATAAVEPVWLAKLELPALCAVAEVDRSAAFLLADDGEAFRLLAVEFLFGSAFLLADDGEAFRLLAFALRFASAFLLADDGEAFRLLAFEFLFDSALVMDRGNSRRAFDAIEELAPATVNTTSSRFERCSTRAVVPGWSRNETTVLSPLRCVFTSAKPRPRSASARGTSAAGILI